MSTKGNVLNYEMVHYASDSLFIAHRADKITYQKSENKKIIKMPLQVGGWKKLCMPFRKARRLIRLDKAMILPTDYGFIMARLGQIWLYNEKVDKWQKSEQELNCRNPMYNAFLRLGSGELFLGEYGNPNGIGKRILKSFDGGLTWQTVYQFKSDEIRHIHCLAWDEYEHKIWIFTGDSDTESKVMKTDAEFSSVEMIGAGSQEWRACHAIFTEKTVEWMMDSPLKEVHHIKYNRESKHISVGQTFPGPVWYARQYDDEVAIAATVQEIGPSHKDKEVHVYKSHDLKQWTEIVTWKHDGWPKRYFRFGTITVCRGEKKMLSCEGVKGLDGKSIELKYTSYKCNNGC